MYPLSFYPRFVLVLAASLLFQTVNAQDCTVEADSLKGSYTGECKKGLANGQGKATGLHTYEGGFKKGLPDGQGTYIWPNGDAYTGKFAKGLKEGNGTITYKKPGGNDSIVEGFWKKDRYLGLYEAPWLIITKTLPIDVIFTKSNIHQIKLEAESIYIDRKPAVNFSTIRKGSYQDIIVTQKLKGSVTTLTMVQFLFRFIMRVGREEFEFELNEPGNYLISIQLKY